MKIRLFKPHIGSEELEGVKEVFARAWLGLGPKVQEFENAWSEYIGAKVGVAVNSATAALHLALAVYGFPKGKKVLVPAITFISTASAVMYNGLEPIFVDVDSDTISMDIDDLRRKYTKDCVAIIPVHMAGHPAKMHEIITFAAERNLVVIEDCAHCAGGELAGKKLGTWGHMGCFSFEEKKCMTTGDGGMICTDDIEVKDLLKAYRWVGIDKDTWRRNTGYTDSSSGDAKHWHYEVSVLGYKYNMNDLAAAIGLAQLKKLDWMNARRGTCIERYLQGVGNCTRIKPLIPYDTQNNVYWIFGVRCTKRDDLILYLKSRGIATGMHFYPLPLHPLFKHSVHICPTAMDIWKTFVTLPLFVDLTNEEIDYVVQTLYDFERKYL